MSSTPASEIVEPSSEPERNLHRRLRNRYQAVAEAIANDRTVDEEVYTDTDEEVEVETMAEEERTISGHSKPSLDGLASCIARPTIQANNFEIKPSVIQMLQHSAQFDGRDTEDPNAHLSKFLDICATFSINGVTDDAIRLRLFPFSLRDRATAWLASLAPGSITTWNQLAEKFLERYFPPAKTTKFRSRILMFRQDSGESIYEAWERYKDLMRKCPHHGVELWVQCEIFYNGLELGNRQIIDNAAGGDFGTLTPRAGFELLEKMALKSYTQQTPRDSTTTKAGVHHVDQFTALAAQMEALNSKVDKLASNSVQTCCSLCGVRTRVVIVR